MSETVNYKYGFFTTLLISGVLVLGSRSAPPQEKPRTPADGHDIHVLAPHKLDGKVMGPYHHYCKAVSNDVLECLIYESTEPNALLKQVEYFVAKNISRSNVSLETWNKFYHDHAVEIATGRVQVLDRSLILIAPREEFNYVFERPQRLMLFETYLRGKGSLVAPQTREHQFTT